MAQQPSDWEKLTEAQRIQTLKSDLEETQLALKNLTHDVGRLAARMTTTETAVVEIGKAINEIKANVPKKKIASTGLLHATSRP